METREREIYREQCRHYRDSMCLKKSEGYALMIGCFGDCKRMREYDNKHNKMRRFTKENPLRVFTSFSGYDSQCMALDRIGIDYELVGWSEIDANAIKGHNLVYPQWADRNYGDISKIDWGKVPDFDLFTFSSPCQDFSNAGLQRGGEEGSGTRSSLLWECRKAILAKRPDYLMLENVKALVSNHFKPLFLRWCHELENYGYRSYYQVLNAKDYGVPQNRERVFAIWVKEEVDNGFYFPSSVPLGKCLADLLDDVVDDKYFLSEKSIEGFLMHNENHEKKGTGFI